MADAKDGDAIMSDKVKVEGDIDMENWCGSSSSEDDNIVVTINKLTTEELMDSGIQDQDQDLENENDADGVTNVPKDDHDDAEGKSQIRFSPPIYLQRYITVRDTLLKFLSNETYCPTLPKTIVEMGCAELSLHKYMKNIHPSVQKLIYMDLDEHCLQENTNKLHPFACEYLIKRETPLQVEAYAGCITKCDPRITNVNPPLFAIVGIELIEHLDPPIVLKFEKTVFGLLSPPIVIITTPNSDFNQVFGLEPGKFRHWDHRFEWSRTEFIEWANKICMEYEGYKVEITGIGEGPEETKPLGTVSQMAVFYKDGSTAQTSLAERMLKYPDIVESDCYKLVCEETYPFFVDQSPREDQIKKGLSSYINCYVLTYSSLVGLREEGITSFPVPLTRFLKISGIPKEVTVEELREAMISLGYQVQTGSGTDQSHVIFPVPEEEEGDESCSENELFEEMDLNKDSFPIPINPGLADLEENWE